MDLFWKQFIPPRSGGPCFNNYPAGIRRFPWVIPFRRPCSEKHGMVLNIDFAPTVFDFAGLEIQGYGKEKT